MKYIAILLSTFIFNFSLFAQGWDEIADMPSGKHHPVTFSLDGYGYAVTGWDEQIGPSDDFTDMTPVKTVGQYCLISQVSLEALPLATHMRIEVILDLVLH